MTQQDWQSQLSFTDRLNAVMRITATYKTAFPDKSSSEIQTTASILETEAFNSALSKDNYNQLWQENLLEIKNATKSTASTESSTIIHQSEKEQPKVQVGPFQDAVYHRQGLFSVVYKATSPTGQIIAVKLTPPSRMSAPHDSLREARILRTAVHDHIIPLYSTHHYSGGQFLLVFPFIPYNLEELFHQHILNPGQIRSHLHDLFSALSHIHSKGIIHRDVKPSNILLASPSGPAYLADFGIAWMDGDEASEPKERKITDVGTTCYRPPELLFGYTSYDYSLDLWAAGCVVAETVMRKDNTLFDAGPLGSELALIQSIFKKLGTPTADTWPEVNNFPAWGKMEFYKFPAMPWSDILPEASDDVRDLVGMLVQYQNTKRLTALAALDHPYFKIRG